MRITLSTGDVQTARRLAEASAARWASRRAGEHYANTLRTHFVGRVGELAFARWLQARGVEHHARFMDPNQEYACDVELWEPHLCVEVKTWAAHHWPRLGRCVAVGQAAKLRRKAHIIAWMVAEEGQPAERGRLREIAVTLAGWNSVGEVLAVKPVQTGAWPNGKPMLNHQLAAAQVRSAETLAQMVTAVAA